VIDFNRSATLFVALTLAASGASAQRRRPKVELEKPTTPAPQQPAAAQQNAASAAVTFGVTMLKPFKARSIGPAVMGGRVSDIAYDPSDPYTFYVGLATGGVMKTSNNGGSFEGIFEKEAVASIGAVAVAPSDPKVVWVGTGEANDRNSSGWGNGVYRSTDGGATWTNTGLGTSRAIARIVIKPDDPRTAWVAAVGDLWTPGGERGLYKTADGGQTWKAVLKADAPYDGIVGCGDVAIDPTNPNVVFAAMYARRRTPWSFLSGPDVIDGKDLGGIFKSTDGGTTWKKLTAGLPSMTGRIGLNVFRKDPRIVYAVVQSAEGGAGADDITSKHGGVFRSDDAGETWTRMSGLDPRPFYFSQIRVDPANDKRVYVLGYALHVSEDGGKTFREDFFAKVHPDCHALAIDWRNPSRLLLGNDGGVYQSYEGGKGWQFLNRIAAGEYYRIDLDMSQPYRIAGGLQDNLNWVGPSATDTKDGIVNADWIDIGGGDGFWCVFDPVDPNVVYAESQQGFLHRFNLKTGELKNLRPEPVEGREGFRFHWDAPLIGSTHAKGVMYLGGNRVFRLSNRGEDWRAISPDLSSRDLAKMTSVGSGAENYGVVYSLAESPVKAGMLWAGTDDGKVWVTEDEGAHWTDVSANVPQPARGQWVSRIEPSAFDPLVAYIAFDAHRAGNFAPLVYRTGDGGKTWQSVAGNLPASGPVRVVREDPRNQSLLFAGTEFGLFISVDRGASWVPFGGLPTVAVDDIKIHPRDRDLVIATHGRSLFVFDDLRPFEDLTAATLGSDATLFAPRPAFGRVLLPGSVDWGGTAEYRGENPPQGAILNYYIREYTGEPAKISVADAANHTVANITAPSTPGFNRVVWDLKWTKDLLTEYGGEGQKFVKPGEYTVTLSYGKTKATQKLDVSIAEGLETR
jgi:photosystem II stability/assembly factor-like uncharacterized protein